VSEVVSELVSEPALGLALKPEGILLNKVPIFHCSFHLNVLPLRTNELCDPFSCKRCKLYHCT